MRNQKGITLIALVITIIVLLILAGVSIAMLTGQNGILTRAGTATDETLIGEAEEAVKLAISTIRANDAAADAGVTLNTTDDPVTLSATTIAKVAKTNNAGSDVTGTDGTEENTVIITYKATADASEAVEVTVSEVDWTITGSKITGD